MARRRAAARGDRDRAASSSRRACRSTPSTRRGRGSTRACSAAGARARRRARPRARGRLGAGRRRCASPFVVRARRAPARPRRRAGRGRARPPASARAARSASACSPPPTALRREVNGDIVTYVVTRNINYTNVCYFRCGFCAFSKGKLAANLRGPAYLVPHDEIARRSREAWDRGATEVCLQGGIHPAFTGAYYLDVVRAVKEAAPEMHVHAFSRARGLAGRGHARARARRVPRAPARRGPRLAARARRRRSSTTRCARVICPDKVTTAQWLEVHEAAHARRPALERDDHVRPRRGAAALGAPPAARARAAARDGRVHRVRAAPVRAHGGADRAARARRARGPTFGEMLLVHAVARLALHPWFTNVQALVGEAGAGGRARGAPRRASTTSAGR